MPVIDILAFVGGLVLLVGGAEILVRGAARLAAKSGISPLVVGLTVVALGTSSPEIAVSVASARSDSAGLALGNVIGSNIANVLLILGLAAVVTPLTVKSRLIRTDVPIMILASGVVLLLALDGALGRGDALVLFALLAGYGWILVRMSPRANPDVVAEFDRDIGQERGSYALNGVLVAAGLALLLFGSQLLLRAALSTASALGVSDLVVGLTLVAAGTSLPEIAISVLAALRGETEIAVGNVVGSNVMNLLAVLGITAWVAPSGIPVPAGALDFDLPVMFAVSIACLPIFLSGHQISRWEGSLFLAYYVAFTAYLLLRATEHDALAPFSAAMAWFVIPITVLTLVTATVRSISGRR